MTTPFNFHLLAKPAGAACNLRCDYCFFLKKAGLYPGSKLHMEDDVLCAYIEQLAESQVGPEVTVAWQGGEPTLMGLDFFRRSIELERELERPGLRFENTIQTNGTLLDAEWCRFFRENDFLVGISLDGPRELHDAYRKDARGRPTFNEVTSGVELLQEHGVEFNILCTVNAANGDHGLEVYRFFRDEIGAKYIQLIPVVERDNETGFQEGEALTGRSVSPRQYAGFLTSVFDEWVDRDVGEVFVLTFDWALAAWAGEPSGSCAFAPTCGNAPALEHNGDLYSCDHFVEPSHLLGNILETPMGELMSGEKQRAFGLEKLDGLPQFCLDCEVRFACHGACPKDRVAKAPDGEPGLNYLCEGYKEFFSHIDEPMKLMAELLSAGRAPSEAMDFLAEARRRAFALVGRNEPCPCGSGLKYKHCHGK